jgi:pilus assembly protein Flp/PilA
MDKIVLATRNFLNDEEGVTAIEYGLIAALVAVAVVVAVTAIGTQLDTLFKKIADCLKSPKGALCPSS